MAHIFWQVHAARDQLFFEIYCILQVRNLRVNFRHRRVFHRVEIFGILILQLFVFFDCQFVALLVLFQVDDHFNTILDHLLLRLILRLS